MSSLRLTSGTHFQDSLPGASLTINVHAVPRPALARTRNDALLLVHFEYRKTRKEESVAIHDSLVLKRLTSDALISRITVDHGIHLRLPCFTGSLPTHLTSFAGRYLR